MHRLLAHLVQELYDDNVLSSESDSLLSRLYSEYDAPGLVSSVIGYGVQSALS